LCPLDERFEGLLDFGPPPDPVRLRETQRVIAEVAEGGETLAGAELANKGDIEEFG